MAFGRDVTIRYVGDSRSAERAARNVAQANDTMSRKFAGVSNAMKRVRQGALLAGGAVGVVAIKFGVDAVKAASNLEESWNKVSVIFGENRIEILKWAADSAKGFGLSRQAAFDAAGSFGNMFSQLGIALPQTTRMSKAMVELAADFASFHNADITEVLIAQQAAFRGEYDALQRFVPVINAAAVEQKALAMTGKESNKELTAGEKAAATYALMMEGAGEALGDFDRTSEGAANKTRTLKAQFEDVTAVIGTALLPIAVSFGDWLSDTAIPKIQQLSGWIRDDFVPALGDIGTWIKKNVLPPLQTMWQTFSEDIVPVFQNIAGFINNKLVPAFDSLMDSITGTNDAAKQSGPAWQGWAVALGVVAAGLAAVVAILAPLTAALKVVAVTFGFLGFAATTAFAIIMRTLPFAHIIGVVLIFKDQIVKFIGTAWRSVKNFFIEGGAFISAKWRESWDRITGTLKNWWESAKAFFSAVWRGIRNFFVEGTADIRRRWSDTWERVTATLRNWWERTADFFRQLPGRIKGYFDGARRWLLEAGKNVIRGLRDGLVDIWNDVKDWFLGIPSWIKEHKGPLSLDRELLVGAGKAIMGGFLRGLRSGASTALDYLKSIGVSITDLFSAFFTGDLFGAIAGFFTGGPQGTSARSNAMLGRQMAQSFGWTGAQWDALNSLVMSESGWSNTAQNPTSTAYGIGQFLDSTWSTVGASKTSDPGAQIAAMLTYIRQRYGDPISAWAFKQSHNWYGKGGVVPGPVGAAQPAVVHGGEGIFTPTQMRHLSVNGGGRATVINNISFAGAIISSRQEAERWVVDALRRAGENGRPITIRGKRMG